VSFSIDQTITFAGWAMPNLIHPIPVVALRTANAALMLAGLSMFSVITAAAAEGPNDAVVRAEQRRVPLSYVTDATVEAIRQSSLSAPVAARVVGLLVQAGDRVKAGQLLAVLDDRELSQAVSANQAQLAQAQAQLAQARANADRTRSLAAQNFVSQSAVDDAQTQLRAAQAGVDALRADVGRTQASRSNARVTAPYDGVVSETHVQVGDLVTPGRPVVTLYAAGGVRAVAHLPQSQVSAVRQLAAAQIQMQSGAWLDAAKVTVLPAADPVTHTTEVRVDLPASDAAALPGQSARVMFKTGEGVRLVVPQESVLRRGELTVVYVQSAQGTFAQRLVRLGESFGAAGIEVLSGLNPGEPVARDPVRAGMAAPPVAARPTQAIKQ
jgi:RND family efflux transporter MFP subunit